MSVANRLLLGGLSVLAGVVAARLVQPRVFSNSSAPTAKVVSAKEAAPGPGHLASTLWILAVGISAYSDATLNLRYGASDARAVVDALSQPKRGGLYTDQRAFVLVDAEATREAILSSYEGILAKAQADDVVLLFFAGHGVREATGHGYYFLPANASPARLRAAAVRAADIDDMVRSLRGAVRAVVVLLDTCHAGASFEASGTAFADELVARLSGGEGAFLLAASQPGQRSQERADLAHGVFTYALVEGLAGAADGNQDGILPVSELFGYVARRVPELTEGTQRPYYKIEGTDFVLAHVDAPGAAQPNRVPREISRPLPQVVSAGPSIHTLGVTEFRNLRGDSQHDWIGKALRVAFNTELSKVTALRVYVPELIDQTMASQKGDLLAARQLGIRTLISGSFQIVDSSLRLDAQIIDTGLGVQAGSDSVEGDVGEFFELQKRLVLSILRRLQVEISPAEGEMIRSDTNTKLDAYRLLLQSEQLVGRTPVAAAPQALPTPQAQSALGRWMGATAVAYADESPMAIEVQVREVLDEFCHAAESRDLNRIAALYVSFSPEHRDMMREYLATTRDLKVEIVDVSVESLDDGVFVNYTRRDRFTDIETGKTVRLEARLGRRFVRENSKWKIGGIR